LLLDHVAALMARICNHDAPSNAKENIDNSCFRR
jgi:hypothetical protein